MPGFFVTRLCGRFALPVGPSQIGGGLRRRDDSLITVGLLSVIPSRNYPTLVIVEVVIVAFIVVAVPVTPSFVIMVTVIFIVAVITISVMPLAYRGPQATPQCTTPWSAQC